MSLLHCVASNKSIHHAESGVHAIQRCVRDKLSRKLTGKRIYILSDSQAPAPLIHSWTVMVCYVRRTWLMRMRWLECECRVIIEFLVMKRYTSSQGPIELASSQAQSIFVGFLPLNLGWWATNGNGRKSPFTGWIEAPGLRQSGSSCRWLWKWGHLCCYEGRNWGPLRASLLVTYSYSQGHEYSLLVTYS